MKGMNCVMVFQLEIIKSSSLHIIYSLSDICRARKLDFLVYSSYVLNHSKFLVHKCLLYALKNNYMEILKSCVISEYISLQILFLSLVASLVSIIRKKMFKNIFFFLKNIHSPYLHISI